MQEYTSLLFVHTLFGLWRELLLRSEKSCFRQADSLEVGPSMHPEEFWIFFRS